MHQFTFGFLGCGNMGGALANAAATVLPADKLAVSDMHGAKTAAMADKATVTDVVTVARESDYVFVAVKPQGLEALFEEIRPILQARTDKFVLVSMAAGVSIARLQTLAGCACPILRMMPNTPVSVHEGMILYTENELMTEELRQGFLNGLCHAGRLDRIPEALIDAGGALSGCGPAYVYLFAEALSDAGVACGLPRAKATLYAAQTLKGAAEMLLSTGKHPGELKDAVCSPGGTTIAGVKALEEGAFRGTTMDAVIAAYRKTAELK